MCEEQLGMALQEFEYLPRSFFPVGIRPHPFFLDATEETYNKDPPLALCQKQSRF
jgi:hypothetical protein